MANTTSPLEHLKNADLLFNEADTQLAIGALGKQINSDYTNDIPVILSVMTGGLIFSGQLIPKLSFPATVNYIHATRYQNGVEGRGLVWIVKPNIDIKNKSVLILDDILDEGITLKAIVDECFLLGANQVKTAVLVEKELGKDKPIEADYVGLKVPNCYVFGFGMDVEGWWRNLPGIYALKNT